MGNPDQALRDFLIEASAEDYYYALDYVYDYFFLHPEELADEKARSNLFSLKQGLLKIRNHGINNLKDVKYQARQNVMDNKILIHEVIQHLKHLKNFVSQNRKDFKKSQATLCSVLDMLIQRLDTY